jgi:6-phosphofructokinase
MRIGIITSGGDAPGLNAVIRAAVLTAHEKYGYEVLGIRQGFDGLLNRLDPMILTPESVEGLHLRGGTIRQELPTVEVRSRVPKFCHRVKLRFRMPHARQPRACVNWGLMP